MGRVVKAGKLTARPHPILPEAQRAAELLAQAQVATFQLRRRAKASTIELSLRIAERIVGETVTQKPALLDKIYDEAVSLVPDTPEGTLFVHPLDRHLSRVDSRVAQGGFQVMEDASVGRGGVRVEAGGVSVDASLGAVLEAVGTALTELIDD